MSTTTPSRPPAPGPAVILDLPVLWAAVEARMQSLNMTQIKELCEATGLDRGTVGRIRNRAREGQIVRGQRGGISVNAYLTLSAFAAGTDLSGPGRLLGAPFGTFADWMRSQAAMNNLTTEE